MIFVNKDIILLNKEYCGDVAFVMKKSPSENERYVTTCTCGTPRRKRMYQVEKIALVDLFPWTEHTETVVLLSQLKQKPDDYINVTIELDDVDITSAETKATYDEIKKYVSEHNAGMKVSNLYISQVKRKCGIEVEKNYNLPKNEDSRQPQCPEDKERAIVEALEHFKMIQQK